MPFSSDSTTSRHLAGEPLQHLGVGAGRGLVGRDHKPAGIRNRVPNLAEPAVGGSEHGRDPLPIGSERGSPGLRRDVLRVVLAETGLELLAHFGAPAHLARVGQEQHRANDAVGEGAPVAVVVVGAREPDALLVAQVGDERDRARCLTGTVCR